MFEHKLKNISIQELEIEIAELLTNKLGENDFKVKINNLKFGFNFDNTTEINLVINEKAFETSGKIHNENAEEIPFEI